MVDASGTAPHNMGRGQGEAGQQGTPGKGGVNRERRQARETPPPPLLLPLLSLVEPGTHADTPALVQLQAGAGHERLSGSPHAQDSEGQWQADSPFPCLFSACWPSWLSPAAPPDSDLSYRRVTWNDLNSLHSSCCFSTRVDLSSGFVTQGWESSHLALYPYYHSHSSWSSGYPSCVRYCCDCCCSQVVHIISQPNPSLPKEQK